MDIRRSQILATLLAEEGLAVRADYAAKTAKFNTETRELTLPAWNHADKSLMNSLIAHEAAHALFTPIFGDIENTYERVLGTKEITPTFHRFMNVVEDARIERKMKLRFKGLAHIMRKGYRNFVELGAFSPDHDNVNSMPELRRMLELEGEKNPISFLPRLNAHAKMGRMLGLSLTDQEEAWYDRMMDTRSFEDVVKLAKEMYDYAIEAAQDETKNEGEPSSEESQESDGVPDDSSTADWDSSEPGEADESGKSETSADDGEKKEDEGDTESGEGENEDEDTENVDEADEESSDSRRDDASDAGEKGTELPEVEGEDDASADGGDDQDPDASDEGEKAVEEALSGASGMGDLYEKINNKNPNLNSRWGNDEHQTISTMGQPDWEKSILPYTVVLREVKQHFANLMAEKNGMYDMPVETVQKGIRETALMVQNKMKGMRPVINSAVNRFERKKAAAMHAKAQDRMTGKLDATKLYKYKVDDRIFLNDQIFPTGQNHGVMMFLDWSGSMGNDNKVYAMIDQAMIFASFAHRVGIKFRIYAFTNVVGAKDLTGELCVPNIPMKRVAKRGINPMTGHNNDFTLIEMFSDKMSKKDMEYMFMVLNFGGWMHAPFLHLAGTPLNSALSIAPFMVRDFKRENKLQKVSFAALTDGDSMGLAATTSTLVDAESGQSVKVSGSRHAQTARLMDWIGRVGKATTTLFCINRNRKRRFESVLKYLDPYGNNGHSQYNKNFLTPLNKRIAAADKKNKDVFIMDNDRSNDGNYGPDALYAITAKAFDSAFTKNIKPDVRKKMTMITNAFVDQLV